MAAGKRSAPRCGKNDTAVPPSLQFRAKVRQERHCSAAVVVGCLNLLYPAGHESVLGRQEFLVLPVKPAGRGIS